MRPSTSARQSPSDLSGFPQPEAPEGGGGGKTAVLAGGDRAHSDKMHPHGSAGMQPRGLVLLLRDLRGGVSVPDRLIGGPKRMVVRVRG
jgi:hypothetical protein